MRYDKDKTVSRQLLKKLYDSPRSMCIQISRRLVGKDDARLLYDRARSLLSAAHRVTDLALFGFLDFVKGCDFNHDFSLQGFDNLFYHTRTVYVKKRKNDPKVVF